MSDIAIEIDGVKKQYAGSPTPAVNNLSLQINLGSVFGLLGPNGAGKSSTIMMICGLLKFDSGKLYVLGLDVEHNGNEIRKRIGVAPQEIALFPTLTAYENLTYFGSMYGIGKKELNESIQHYLEIFGLKEKIHKKVQTFSGGMKRRLNLIAAMLHHPEVLILDEPTAGVDVQSRSMIFEFLSGLKKEGKTIVYSSHYLDEAEKLCTDIAIIDEGKLISSGKTSALLQQHAECKHLEDLFLKLTGKEIRE